MIDLDLPDPLGGGGRGLPQGGAATTDRDNGVQHRFALSVEGPHARGRADKWLAASAETKRCSGWMLVAAMAMCDEATPDSWFLTRLAELEKTLQASPNARRQAMLSALIAIGGRNKALRKAATAVAHKIGTVEIDHGDTSCKTPEFMATLEKTWARATSKGFESPAAQERARESMRTRC